MNIGDTIREAILEMVPSGFELEIKWEPSVFNVKKNNENKIVLSGVSHAKFVCVIPGDSQPEITDSPKLKIVEN